MKKLLAILAFAPLAFSCSKETANEAPAPKMMVTVEATSMQPATIVIPGVGSETFQGTYKKTFTAPGHMVSVNVHSDFPCVKTLKISVNGETIAQRSGNCEGTEYALACDLNQY